MYGKILILAGAAGLLAACASNDPYGYNDRSATTNRALGGAAVGAGVGAAAGAIAGNEDDDIYQGAAIGAGVGAVAGAISGDMEDRRRREGRGYENRGYGNEYGDRYGPNGERMYYDDRARRYYYADPRNGCTYWENGQYRGC